jgi:hypothetical protein
MSMGRKAVKRWSGARVRKLNQGELGQLDIARLVEEMLNSSKLRPSTKSNYRCALLWAFRETDIFSANPTLERALQLLADFRQRDQQQPAAPVARSREPGRHIPEADLAPLVQALAPGRQTQEMWRFKTGMWLIAGSASGARPVEWQKAHWLDREKGILRMPNSKLKKHPSWERIPACLVEEATASIERESYYANAMGLVIDPETKEELARLRAWEARKGELAWRDLVIDECSRMDVSDHMDALREYLEKGGDHDFARYFKNCRKAIWEASKRAFPDGRLYSLYDARSTAAANMQAAFDKADAALALGHCSTRARTLPRYADRDKAYSTGARTAPRAAETATQLRLSASVRDAHQADIDQQRAARAAARSAPPPPSDGGDEDDARERDGMC